MFDHCLYFNTTSLARKLEREWVSAFKPFGLTPSQAFMLRVILKKPRISYSSLASDLNISKATCSRTVEGLIRLGFVSREQAGEDARSFVLMPLTPAKTIETALEHAGGSATSKMKRIIGNKGFEETVKTVKSVKSALG